MEALMDSIIYEEIENRIGPGIVNAATKSTSPIKRWLQVPTLPQAVSIVFGRLFEETMNNLIDRSEHHEAITNSSDKTFITPDCKLTTVAKGNKDVDILFRQDDTIFYREAKCNLRLDSEKSKVTSTKVNEISSRLQRLYPNCKIDAAILNMDWKGKKSHLRGVRIEYIGEFMNRLEIETITEQDWLDHGRKLGYYYKEGVDGR